MYRILISVILIMMSFSGLRAQESQLALQYFKDGEYEKAAELYKGLYEKNYRNDYFFRYYFNSLVNMGEYKDAEKVIKKAIKNRPQDVYLLVRQGGLLVSMGEEKKAQKLYDEAIKKLDKDRNQVVQTGAAFMQLKEYELALKVYEKGTKLSDNKSLYASSLGSLYRQLGDRENMVKYYLLYGKTNANTVKYVKQLFLRQLDDSLSHIIQNQLYANIQKEPEESVYVDMLAWLFIQKKDYSKALRQMISLDRRLNEEGARVYELAAIAKKDRDLETAIKAYRYIIDQKNIQSPYFLESKRSLLITMREKLDISGELPEKELLEIRDGYVNTLNELGKNNQTVSLSIEYAEFEAYYMNNLEKAIEILLELIERKDVDERLQARAKLNLGDYYLMYGEFWESSLLYSQVDKSFQEGILGELARYKNARLSYFNGDFEWSKMQLDVLKPSTSKLISNDAIDLSVFISENTGLDTTTIPLEMFAAAELLALQHKYEASFERLDSINILYPDHELEDDIWYLKANIYTDLKDYDNAVKYYNDIILKHADDIRGDNAIFELAQLYETTLNNQEEAISLYEKLFLDYSSSTFSIEARKKYRTLTKKEGENKEADPEELSPEENFMRGIKN